jgi:hypothetical protein
VLYQYTGVAALDGVGALHVTFGAVDTGICAQAANAMVDKSAAKMCPVPGLFMFCLLGWDLRRSLAGPWLIRPMNYSFHIDDSVASTPPVTT